MLTWDKIKIQNNGKEIEAVAPIIISASRSTDIPAFYSDWFMNRLEAGYLKWINPFNRKEQFVSTNKTRVIVFWTKNAKPIFKHLKVLDENNINYYFTYTLNDYEQENLEPYVPKIEDKLETFKRLSSRLGREKVIWRFDPLILSDKITVEMLLERIHNLAYKLKDFTEKLVVSFADIEIYSKVKKNLENINKDKYREFDIDSVYKIAKGLKELKNELGLKIATCSERLDLSDYGIERNKCIDDELMKKIFSEDELLMNFLGYSANKQQSLFLQTKDEKSNKLKDKGQRKECGCIMSKDIGAYNTCKHLCSYCYANHSQKLVLNNSMKANSNSDSIID